MNKFFYSTIVLLSCLSCSGPSISPVKLRCEYMDAPRVIESSHPSLSWVNKPGNGSKGAGQSAYLIEVASSRTALQNGEADLWNSGIVKSAQSVGVRYEGKALNSGQDCWWRVKVWDEKGKESAWSTPGYWGMGILDRSEWMADWIGAPWQGEEPYKKVELEKPFNLPPGMSMESFLKIVQMYMDHPSSRQGILQSNSQTQEDPAWEMAAVRVPKIEQTPAPLLRKTFTVGTDIVSAKAFVVGLGYYELYVNGEKIGDEVLMPNQTNYGERPIVGQYGQNSDHLFRNYRVLYTAYDITEKLVKGENAVGAILGEGFYNATGTYQIPFGSSRLLCQIQIRYKDGHTQAICTDKTWKAAASPILVNGVFEGEVYDAGREIPGWASAAYDDSAWEQAALRKAPEGELTAQTAPGDVVYDVLSPVSVQKRDDGSFDVDFGAEITGWVRFRDVAGNPGDTLTVTYTNDQLTSFNQYIFGQKKLTDYAPRFTWFTFSKVNVKGIQDLQEGMMQAEWVCTDLPSVATFHSSEPLLEQILAIWRRSQLDNIHGGVPSDCPHRERSGYTGDGLLSASAVMENFDAAAFYKKWVRDINDCQNTETGHVPNVAPTNNGAGGIGWGAAICVVPWEYYVHYADKGILEDNFLAMKEYVRYMQSLLGEDGIIDSTKDPEADKNVGIMGSLGDWCPPYENPDRVLVHQFYFWKCADICSKTASILGQTEESRQYARLAQELYGAFQKRFYDSANNTYGPFGANVFALEMGVPQEHAASVARQLRKEIMDEHDGHIITGIFGTRYLFKVLSDNGLDDIVLEMLQKRDFPSFGYWIEQGATTTWENWNGSGSHNHPMFGGGLTWLYNSLAGIRPDEQEPGYKHIIVRPAGLSTDYEASYSLETIYGTVSSSVKSKGDHFTLQLTVPAGCKATVTMPFSGEEYQVNQGTHHFSTTKR